ncbi:MAG: Gfo/Idh/MocA family oxidoreductase [Nocardioidaceae bacterium]|nr:Gfo/Idh/MocA family oxidoreductase [Nocardioidaceae bacterium]
MSTQDSTVRFGLVGTGFWAREVHARGVQAHPGSELGGVWGRDPGRTESLAGDLGVAAHADFDELVASVDALAFAVPPDVQAPLAVRAARAGRHLLLEKPVALDAATADEVVAAADAGGVSSVVFFTERFVPEREAWLQGLAERDCRGGRAVWLASLKTPDNPFAHSPWRQEHGGLWDVGPHALSVLLPVLGPVVDVAGAQGEADLVHLVLTHESGATSTAHLSLTMPPAATQAGLSFYDEDGWYDRPEVEGDAVKAHTLAVGELVDAVRAGRSDHRCDVRFGAEVVRVLERAQRVVGRHV